MTPMTQFSITDLQLVVMRLLLQKIEVLRRGVNHKGVCGKYIATLIS